MADELLIWQWVDSAFPAGAFAHSGGLESAWQAGQVDGDQLPDWLNVQLTQTARGSLPYMTAAHRSPDDVAPLCRHCDLFLSNHVANRASRVQGLALLRAVPRVFGSRVFGSPSGSEIAAMADRMRASGDPSHWPVVFGVCCAHLGIALGIARQSFVFVNLRGWISAAVRLGIVGPLEGQSIQFRLLPRAGRLAEGEETPIDAAAQTAPLSDLLQAAQDRLYSRLFQS